MSCGCVASVNEMLAERNTRLTLPLVFDGDGVDRLMIVTEQIETGRGKKWASGMFASFCPFCGEKYPDRKGPLA